MQIATAFAGTLLLSALIFLLALSLKRTILTYAAVGAMLFIPHLICLTGQRIGNSIDLTQLQDTDRLMRYVQGRYGDFRMAAIVFAAAFLLTAGYFAFSLRSVKKGIRV